MSAEPGLLLRVLRPKLCLPLLLIEPDKQRVAMLQYRAAEKTRLLSHEIK